MNPTMYDLVMLTVQLVFGILAVYIVPTLAKAVEQSLAETEIGKAVLTAQQTLWKETGAARKEFAMKAAREALDALHISMSDDQLSALIEAAVYEMKMANGSLNVSTEESDG